MFVYSRRVFFQAEDGIRDLVRSRGLGDVYKRQAMSSREECKRAALESDNRFNSESRFHEE